MVRVLSLLLLLALTASARAQSLNVQAFHPSPHPGDYITVQGTETMGHLRWGLALALNHGRYPLVVRDRGGAMIRGAVSDQLTANILFSLGLLEFMEVGLDLPVHVYMAGQGLVPGEEVEPVGVGDMRLVPRFRIIDHGGRGLGLAASLDISLPLGRQVSPYMGAYNVTLLPQLMVEVRYPLIRASLNIGYSFVDGVEVGDVLVDDRLVYSLAAAIQPRTDLVEILAEAYGSASVADILKENERTLEIIGALRFLPLGRLSVTAGAGAGLLAGYGSPQWRAFLTVGYSSPVRPQMGLDVAQMGR